MMSEHDLRETMFLVHPPYAFCARCGAKRYRYPTGIVDDRQECRPDLGLGHIWKLFMEAVELDLAAQDRSWENEHD